jgi:hypothetical protein
LLFDNRSKTSVNLYDSYINSDKTGYNEILKYNIHNNCDEKTTKMTLSSSKKSSLSPFKKLSLSPSRKSSLSPSKKLSLSPSRKSSLSPLYDSSSINGELTIENTKFKNIPQSSLHYMSTRSKVLPRT